MITSDLVTEIQRLDFGRGRTIESVAEELGASLEEAKSVIVKLTALGKLAADVERGPGLWIVRYHAPDKWVNEKAALKRRRVRRME